MLYDSPSLFGHHTYQSFVGAFVRLGTLASSNLRDAAEAERMLRTHQTRAGLPRPARYRGRNAPSARKMAIAQSIRNNTPQQVVRAMKDWVSNRFDVASYRAFLGTVDPSAGELAQVAARLLYADGELVLDYSDAGACWMFGLSMEEQIFAAEVMAEVPAVISHALTALRRARAAGPFNRLARFFFYNGVPFDANDLAAIERVFQRIEAPVLAMPHTLALCRTDNRLQGGRSAEAYVSSAPLHQGAMIFLGNAFFGPSAKNYRGTELYLFRAATIVHELTHLFARTDDVRGDDSYGRGACGKLPVAEQRKNADNYGLFAFEAARSMVFRSGQALRDDMLHVLDVYGVN